MLWSTHCTPWRPSLTTGLSQCHAPGLQRRSLMKLGDGYTFLTNACCRFGPNLQNKVGSTTCSNKTKFLWDYLGRVHGLEAPPHAAGPRASSRPGHALVLRFRESGGPRPLGPIHSIIPCHVRFRSHPIPFHVHFMYVRSSVLPTDKRHLNTRTPLVEMHPAEYPNTLVEMHPASCTLRGQGKLYRTFL